MSVVLDRSYAAPGRVVGDYLSDPVRLFSIVVVLVVLGYGSRGDNMSPMLVSFLEPVFGNVFSMVEALLIVVAGLELMRRIAIGDYWVDRSPISRQVMFVGIVVCAYPLMHMFIVEGGLRFPLELMFMPVFIATFFLYLFLFRRTELPVMIWLVVIAGCYKLLEGAVVFANWGISWGLLTGWRDGLLLSMMAMGGVIALMIRSDGDETYTRIRRVLIWLLPLSTAIFMGSMRRSYMLGIALALPMIIYLVRGRERRTAIVVSVVFVIAAAAVIVVMGTDFGDRVTSSVSDPSKEGSSAYRLLEIYNVTMMIMERPLTGWPMGAMTRNATGIDFVNVSGLVPHNVYLYTMLRAGILGLVAWCFLMWSSFRMNLRTVRAARRPLERFLSLWLLSTTICMIASGFTSPVIADRLQLFLAFPLVMASFLPGAWPLRKTKA